MKLKVAPCREGCIVRKEQPTMNTWKLITKHGLQLLQAGLKPVQERGLSHQVTDEVRGFAPPFGINVAIDGVTALSLGLANACAQNSRIA